MARTWLGLLSRSRKPLALVAGAAAVSLLVRQARGKRSGSEGMRTTEGGRHSGGDVDVTFLREFRDLLKVSRQEIG